jgi:transcriptional regulator with XRE-family HTH domain
MRVTDGGTDTPEVTAPAPALLVPPVRLGRLLRDTREAQGESIPALVRRSGLAYDDEWFERLESGGVALDEALVRWVGALYGIGASEIVPARSQLVIDLDEGLIAVGARRVPLPNTPGTTTNAESLLGNYLGLVYLLRDLPPGTPIPMREVDIAVLAQALQRDDRDVRTALARLISSDRDGLVLRSSSLRRRVVVPVAGILVGLTAVGGLLLVRSTASDARADDLPATEEGPAATAREQPAADAPVEIGDAVVLERGGAQTTR